jgi:hypothetical protein
MMKRIWNRDEKFRKGLMLVLILGFFLIRGLKGGLYSFEYINKSLENDINEYNFISGSLEDEQIIVYSISGENIIKFIKFFENNDTWIEIANIINSIDHYVYGLAFNPI